MNFWAMIYSDILWLWLKTWDLKLETHDSLETLFFFQLKLCCSAARFSHHNYPWICKPSCKPSTPKIQSLLWRVLSISCSSMPRRATGKSLLERLLDFFAWVRQCYKKLALWRQSQGYLNQSFTSFLKLGWWQVRRSMRWPKPIHPEPLLKGPWRFLPANTNCHEMLTQ